MRDIDETLQPFRAAIGGMRRVEQHTVIAPAAIAGELRHRQNLDGGDADIDETIEIVGNAVEGAVGGERAGMQLVEDGLFPGAACPVRRLPVIGCLLYEPARPM